MSADTGINELMRDLGAAMSGKGQALMLGGGNPGHLPEVEALWREQWRALEREPGRLERVLGNYDGPQGNPEFIEALADGLRRLYGWDIRSSNIAVVNGSQNAFFYLFNLLAGLHADGTERHILLPLMPEYIGYADQAIHPTAIRALPPRIELIGDHRFKYHVDLERLVVANDTAALCVSRPTNPTGNVLSAGEMSRLHDLAAAHDLPLIIDNAYGAPFPDIIFSESVPSWSRNTVLVMSLSKLGLPGTRTGIIVGPDDLIKSVAAMNAVAGLASGNVGQAIAGPLLQDGRLLETCRTVIRPYYERKSVQALRWLDDAMNPELPYRIHVSEGAMFLWLWFDRLPVSAEVLYQRLKDRGVVVVPGHYFFYGLEEEHPHQHQCLRLSYAMDGEVVRRGISILAEEVEKAYAVG